MPARPCDWQHLQAACVCRSRFELGFRKGETMNNKFQLSGRQARSTSLLLAVGIAACLSSAARAELIYTLQTVIPIPVTAANAQPGGAFNSFDISFFDPVTRRDYVADRSNASVDIISGASLTVVGQATGFVGQQATTSRSGPDGVVAVTTGGGGKAH